MPAHTIELFNLPEPQDGKTIGYRVTGNPSVPETDADYLLRSLSETLAHIGVKHNSSATEIGAYPWPL